MRIPILDLTRQYEALRVEINEGIRRVVESGWFILGPEVEALEREIADFCGAKYGIGVASGTDALLIALRALGIGPGDAVIVPSFTFFATAGVVHNVGATPIFCDINPQTFNLDPSDVRRILTARSRPRTMDNELQTLPKAIIPVHLYGQMADMDEIMDLASEFGLYVIEDAAQAIGAEHRGSKAGCVGHLGCFSFFPTKNLGAYGDGGMVVTNDGETAERVRMLRAHGSKPKYYHHLVGYNSRIDALQAAILRVKLGHIAPWIEARQRIAERYDELLRGITTIHRPYRAPNRSHSFHQYTLRIVGNRRDSLRSYLGDKGVGTEVYYPLPLHLQECFRFLGYKEGDLPHSEAASREVLSLPMFPELRSEEVSYVVETVASFCDPKRSARNA